MHMMPIFTISNQGHKYDHFDVIILVRHKKPW